MLGATTRKLNRDSGERKALFRDLVSALIVHGRIETTVAKAKETKKIAERGRGGYTRLVRTRTRRGDATEMAIVEFVS
jgi:ribosomal protein L17